MTTHVVAVSGHFDPVTPGHMKLFESAKALGTHLVVIVNNDVQTAAKKGRPFMPVGDRVEVLRGVRWVDEVVLSVDDDGTVCRTLEAVRPHVFANGGDVTEESLHPAERVLCERLGIRLAFGVGGGKTVSSRNYLRGWLDGSGGEVGCGGGRGGAGEGGGAAQSEADGEGEAAGGE